MLRKREVNEMSDFCSGTTSRQGPACGWWMWALACALVIGCGGNGNDSEADNTQSSSDADSDTDTDGDSDTDTDGDSDTATDGNPNTDTESGNDIGTDSDIVSDTEQRNETETHSDVGDDSESESEWEVDTDTGTELPDVETDIDILCPDGSSDAECVDECSYRVDAATTENGDGTSWETAFRYVQDAVDAAYAAAEADDALNSCQVWVKEGEYLIYDSPSATALQLRSGVHLLGGFAGGETVAAQRNPAHYRTSLDANSRGRVLVCAEQCGDNTIVDGFQITGGLSDENGGGMLNIESAPTIHDCQFIGNVAFAGGGMYNQNASPLISHCRFEENRTVAPPTGECEDGYDSGSGGGMHNNGGAPHILDCEFVGNAAGSGSAGDTSCLEANGGDGGHGGGIANFDATVIIENTVFKSNRAGDAGSGWDMAYGHTGSGGAMANAGGTVSISNCLFLLNSTGSNHDSSVFSSDVHLGAGGGISNTGAAMRIINTTFYNNDTGIPFYQSIGNGMVFGEGQSIYSSSGEVTVINSILWNDDTIDESVLHIVTDDDGVDVSYCNIKGDYPGTGNISSEPMFVDAVNGDFRLKDGSPCIDAGNTTEVTATADIAGGNRVSGGDVDMGAYEVQ